MDASNEAERGLTDIEGFLYWEAHRRAAHRRAAEFASQVVGLDDGQRADIEGWYVEEQIRVSHVIVQHITDHITAVEAHHTKRYTRLRRGAYLALALTTAAILGLCIALIFATAG